MKKLFTFQLAFFACLMIYAQSDPKEKSLNYLQTLLSQKNFSEEEIAMHQVVKHHVSSISDVHHMYLRQSVNDLQVYGTESSIHIMKDGTLLASNINFIENISDKIQTSESIISPVQAVTQVASHLGYALTENLSVISQAVSPDRKTIVSDGGISLSPIPVQLMYYRTTNDQVVLAWDLSIQAINKTEWYSVRVNAATGALLDKGNWITSCNFDHPEGAHHHAENTVAFEENCDANYYTSETVAASSALLTGSYQVFAMPLESPLYGDRTIVTNVPHPVASPYGWHDTNGVAGAEFTDTRGNNVNAYEAGDNYGYRPDGGSSLIFHFPFNPVYSNGDQSEAAAITNLYYWNNVIHDVFYMYGFDEASGNFQVNNYGKGGFANDPVLAEAQSGQMCNAFFATPEDGSSPNMYMYVCGSRDGNFDNLVVMHEYGHGISNRLTGSSVNCLWNDEQMGEGWSDYFGLMLTMRTGDEGTDARGIGTFLFGEGPGGPGIRTHPYSTNMSVNPHTYDHIKSEWAPHGVGSVWAVMLWDMTWLLVDEYGFDTDFYEGTGGNNVALALVTEGLKLQPCSPGFVDGRDAILDADVAMYSGDNECLIWHAFARRGLGYSANQGSSNSKNDGTQAFDMPPHLFSVECPTEDIEEIVSEGQTYTLPDFVSSSLVTINSECDILTYTVVQNPAAGTELSVGTHPVTITVTTSTSQQVICSFDVIVTQVVNVEDHEWAQHISVFPNPTSDRLTISNQSNETIISATIVDVNGKVLDEINFSENMSEQTISVENLAAGVYFIKLTTENSSLVKQIIKK